MRAHALRNQSLYEVVRFTFVASTTPECRELLFNNSLRLLRVQLEFCSTVRPTRSLQASTRESGFNSSQRLRQ